MTPLEPIAWNYLQCRNEAKEFEDLLNAKHDLSEQDDILPFFGSHKNVAALCTTYNPYVTIPDRIRLEYQLLDAFRCDLVTGRWGVGYTFVEFEDATPKSVFEKKKKATLQW